MSKNEFLIAESDSFEKKINSRDFVYLKSKLKDYVYPALRKNPFFGPNIKKLKPPFENVYRYRIGSFRLFYTIENENLIFIAIDIAKRKDAYR